MRTTRIDAPAGADPQQVARASAALAEAVAVCWRLVAECHATGMPVPHRVLRFLGEPVPTRRTGAPGKAPGVWGAVRRWFVARDNAPATADQITAGTGLSRDQVDRLVASNMRHRFVRARVAGEGRVYEYQLGPDWLEETEKE